MPASDSAVRSPSLAALAETWEHSAVRPVHTAVSRAGAFYANVKSAAVSVAGTMPASRTESAPMVISVPPKGEAPTVTLLLNVAAVMPRALTSIVSWPPATANPLVHDG
jgi:hypothetical protein